MSPAGTGLAGVRLAATRHAVNDIQDALRRMAAGSYGICQRCARPITARTAAGGADHPVVSDLPGRPLRLVRMHRLRPHVALNHVP